MTDTKNQLRAQLKQDRLALSDDQHQLKSRFIVERLEQVIDWPSIRTLHYFEPIARLKEVDISGLIKFLVARQPQIRLYTSFQDAGVWWVTHHGSKAPITAPPSFDVVIVPMLGFDPKTLHRIGYGGGYYDKFLASQPKAQKIGVCFESGKLKKIPTEPHDIALDIIITDLAAYS